MIGYIFDQSHWNKLGNLVTARASGAFATFIRFGSINSYTGKCYDDYLVDENVDNAKVNAFPFGGYFYMRPKFDGTLQGRYFVELLKKYRPQLPAVVDVEEVGDYRNVIKMFEEIRKAGFSRMLYTRQNIWDYNFPPDTYWKQVELWAARWTSAPLDGPWGDGNFVFRDFPTWKYWQFSADGNGRAEEFGFPPYPIGDNDLDLNYYNGTWEQFVDEYDLDGLEPIPSNGYIVNTQGLRIRTAPYVGAAIVGHRNSGDLVVPSDYGGSEFWIKDELGWSAVNYAGTQHMRKA